MNKAQEFEVFRFLIAAIMGLAILVIILSIIAQLNEIKKDVNMADLYSKIDSAVEGAGINKVIVAKEISFKKGDFISEAGLKERYLNLERIYFDGKTSCFEIINGKGIKAKKDCIVDVYIKCSNTAENNIECTISLGRRIEVVE